MHWAGKTSLSIAAIFIPLLLQGVMDKVVITLYTTRNSCKLCVVGVLTITTQFVHNKQGNKNG